MNQAIFKGQVSQKDAKPQSDEGEIVNISIGSPDGNVYNTTATLDSSGAFDTTATPYLCTQKGAYVATASLAAIEQKWSQASSAQVTWVIGDVGSTRTLTMTVEVV